MINLNEELVKDEYQVTANVVALANDNLVLDEEQFDVDAQTYMSTLYVFGKEFDKQENKKGARYIAMKMQTILDAFPDLKNTLNSNVLEFISDNQAFLAEKYKIIDKSMKKTMVFNVIAIALITYFFMRFSPFICILIGLGIGFLMEKFVGKRVYKKLDAQILNVYSDAISEDLMNFINLKVYL